MADIRISGLPAAVFADLTSTDIMEMSDLDVAPALQSKKVTLALLRQFMLTAATVLTSLTLGAAGAAYAVDGTSTAVAVDAVAGAITHTANLSRGAGAPGTFVFKVGGVLGSSNTLQTAATVLTIGDQVTTFVGSLRSLVGKIGLGTTPGTTGAINVDATTGYSNFAFRSINTGGVADYRVLVEANAVDAGNWGASVFNLYANGLSKWQVGADAAGTSIFVSISATARFVGGSTNGLAFRNSGNTRDNFLVADNGSAATINDGTRSSLWTLASTTNERLAGAFFAGTGATATWLSTTSSAGGSVGLVYYNQTNYYAAVEVLSVAAGFGTLSLMKSGGNVVIGGTAAGATASGVLAFGTTAATEPTATVDLVQLYGFDFGAGQRALSLYQEYAPYAGVAVASTHKVPIRVNGVAFYFLATTVA